MHNTSHLKVILILFICINISFSVSAKTFNNSNHTWETRLKEIDINILSFANNDREMLYNNTYQKLRNFFINCTTPYEFYNRINMSILEKNTINPWQHDCYGFDLSRIVDTVVNKKKPILWCHQQAILFAAGVKAVFSHYDEDKKQFVLNKNCGEFKIEIWRSLSLIRPVFPYRSHVQLIIDKWNGTDTFIINNKTVDKIEVDTSENEPIREWHKTNECLIYPFFPAKLNSIMFTS
ncbi:MAG: hypothetical protein DRN24_01210 [Thermoplasmata archaeon]|nr:MAG: hypothetical protein DRN24_01210 [Thermoplasmata archaeon]